MSSDVWSLSLIAYVLHHLYKVLILKWRHISKDPRQLLASWFLAPAVIASFPLTNISLRCEVKHKLKIENECCCGFIPSVLRAYTTLMAPFFYIFLLCYGLLRSYTPSSLLSLLNFPSPIFSLPFFPLLFPILSFLVPLSSFPRSSLFFPSFLSTLSVISLPSFYLFPSSLLPPSSTPPFYPCLFCYSNPSTLVSLSCRPLYPIPRPSLPSSLLLCIWIC